jgi:hypothetical protein
VVVTKKPDNFVTILKNGTIMSIGFRLAKTLAGGREPFGTGIVSGRVEMKSAQAGMPVPICALHQLEMWISDDERIGADGLCSAVTLPWTCLLWLVRLVGDLNVHCIWRQIDLTGPRDCAAVNEDLLEESRIPQRGKGTGKLFLPQLHPPR